MTDGDSPRHGNSPPSDRNDQLHGAVRAAVRHLKTGGEQLVTTLQNVSEFWNVCTRPASSRGGLGLSVEQTEKRLRLLERFVTVLPEPAALYKQWRDLVVSHAVKGVQVHDARIAAAMKLHGINQILTLNGADFVRYEFLNPISLVDQ